MNKDPKPQPLTPSQMQELEEKIRSSIPNNESRELKFGCVVKYKNEEAKLMHSHRRKNRQGEWEYVPKPLGGEVYYEVWSDLYGVTVYPIDESKILGKELGLADVLLATEKTINWKENNWADEPVATDLAGILYEWDLTKTYSQQKPELYSFLHSLLCH